jgi:DNA-binding transcriptional ArsR family regulator
MLNDEPAPDQIFKALADPTRLAIIDRLSHGRASVSELAKPFGISLAGIVQHVQALENAKLIVTKKSGRIRLCSINPGALRAAEGWIAERRQFWERQFDQLAAEIDEAALDANKER